MRHKKRNGLVMALWMWYIARSVTTHLHGHNIGWVRRRELEAHLLATGAWNRRQIRAWCQCALRHGFLRHGVRKDYYYIPSYKRLCMALQVCPGAGEVTVPADQVAACVTIKAVRRLLTTTYIVGTRTATDGGFGNPISQKTLKALTGLAPATIRTYVHASPLVVSYNIVDLHIAIPASRAHLLASIAERSAGRSPYPQAVYFTRYNRRTHTYHLYQRLPNSYRVPEGWSTDPSSTVRRAHRAYRHVQASPLRDKHPTETTPGISPTTTPTVAPCFPFPEKNDARLFFTQAADVHRAHRRDNRSDLEERFVYCGTRRGIRWYTAVTRKGATWMPELERLCTVA